MSSSPANRCASAPSALMAAWFASKPSCRAPCHVRRRAIAHERQHTIVAECLRNSLVERRPSFSPPARFPPLSAARLDEAALIQFPSRHRQRAGSVRVRARCACHHLLSVSAFSPSTRCCMLPGRVRRTGCARGTPSIRTAVRLARPRQITGASTNPQRCELLWLIGLSAQISEAMNRAPRGHDAVFEGAPQRDQQFPRQGDRIRCGACAGPRRRSAPDTIG